MMSEFAVGFIVGAVAIGTIMALFAYLTHRYVTEVTLTITRGLCEQQNILYQNYIEVLGYPREMRIDGGDEDEGEYDDPQRF
jgi:hypothetical protein